MLELFNPQPIPKLTPRSQEAEPQVVEWRPDDPLPWLELDPPKAAGKTERVWRHTVYVGVYDLEATYERLHAAFGEDRDAYDERNTGLSACAAILVDQQGQLIVETVTLSTALWAVARLHSPGLDNPHWHMGFDLAAASLVEAVDRYEGSRLKKLPTGSPLHCDGEALHQITALAQTAAGVRGVNGLATNRVFIKSQPVSVDSAEASQLDFLNSYFLTDLATVRSSVDERPPRAALKAYLTPDHQLQTQERIDVIEHPDTVDEGVGIARLPSGRWPSSPDEHLARSQQFAVNQALNDLTGHRGLMGVNGPPGTGKTTMLRDILAGNVVERARRLAVLNHPLEAFTSTTHRWTTKGRPRIVRQLKPELTGFEMVVACANNSAAANVSNEIPSNKAIGSNWSGCANYFADIASAVLSEAGTAGRDPVTPRAWGLVAAALGNKENTRDFHSAFWFDREATGGKPARKSGAPRMQARLNAWADGSAPHPSWPHARQHFTDAQQRVDALIAVRARAQDRLHERHSLPSRLDSLRSVLTATERGVKAAADEHRECGQELTSADAQLSEATIQYERHLSLRPRFLEDLFTFGRASSAWRQALDPLSNALSQCTQMRAHRLQQAQLSQDQHAHLCAERDSLYEEIASVERRLSELAAACLADEEAYGAAYPEAIGSLADREMRTPWLDEELDEARSALFLAALQLHQDFLANVAAEMLPGLRAALEVMTGACPRNLEPTKRLAAWQLFFLVVPLVSTTFASYARLFSGITEEGLGWLFIDEAGQASPQFAVGAIWRSQRVIAVGDPLQLQPVVTIPHKAQRDIAKAYSVSSTWIAPQASVQTLADRVARFGTTLSQGEERQWVSAPLRVHRRCDDPMFTLCNEIAYEGIMVNGVAPNRGGQRAGDPFGFAHTSAIPPSHWAHEPAHRPGTHLQPNQIARLKQLLQQLESHGVLPKDVITISPFRSVADALKKLTHSHPGLTAGTIHTAQGREADVAILVLGGDPTRPGAKAWAASSVNLVNVAVSRARRRLYVVGDRSAWEQHNYFRQLAATLPTEHPHA
ncbi:MAG: AAA family ATPase [Propionicimonas sp.]